MDASLKKGIKCRKHLELLEANLKILIYLIIG
jgi:hypothetical protein